MQTPRHLFRSIVGVFCILAAVVPATAQGNQEQQQGKPAFELEIINRVGSGSGQQPSATKGDTEPPVIRPSSGGNKIIESPYSPPPGALPAAVETENARSNPSEGSTTGAIAQTGNTAIIPPLPERPDPELREQFARRSVVEGTVARPAAGETSPGWQYESRPLGNEYGRERGQEESVDPEYGSEYERAYEDRPARNRAYADDGWGRPYGEERRFADTDREQRQHCRRLVYACDGGIEWACQRWLNQCDRRQ